MLNAPRMKKCAALACKRQIGLKKLVCVGHWAIVPNDIRKELLDAYIIGQDATGRVTPRYRVAVSEMVKFIAFREGVLVKEEKREDRDDGRGGQDEYDNPE